MSNQPLVSILIPVFNHKEFIGLSIDSALKQDYPSIEIIITDNASDDGTKDVLENYASKHENNICSERRKHWAFIELEKSPRFI